MSRKRRNTSSSGSDDGSTVKRPRPSWINDFEDNFEHPTSKEQSRIDSSYGQRGAFPGLDDDNVLELPYDGPSDGIEYLRVVRAEAKGVPHLLTAPGYTIEPHATAQAQSADIAHRADHGGFFEDGAYVAAPVLRPMPTTSETDIEDAQDAYYKALAARFLVVRTTLRCTPPLSAIQNLDRSHPISLPPNCRKARKQWLLNIDDTDPVMVQLACMDSESVLGVVRILTRTVTKTLRARSARKTRRLSAWIWGILAKCNDRGELSSEEIAELRELGKKAVGILVGIRDQSDKVYGQEEDEAGTDDMSDTEKAGEDFAAAERAGIVLREEAGADAAAKEQGGEMEAFSALENAKARLRASLSQDDPLKEVVVEHEDNKNVVDVDRHIRVLLDMIISIVGESYGQRDLLEFRDMWDDDLKKC